MLKNFFVISLVVLVAVASAQNRQGRQGGRQNNNMIGLLQRSDVQSELKLSDDQKSKLEAMRPARGQGGNRGGGNGGGGNGGGGNGGGGQRPAQDPEAMAKAAAEREKTTLEVLSPEQTKRLLELYIQRVGSRAVIRADVQEALKINSTQKEKIAELQKNQREATQAVMEKVRNGEIERTALADIQKKNDSILQDELNKILSAEQREKLKSMGGAPFKFDADSVN
jgi:hypothetical protein